MSYFMKIRQVGLELLVEGRTDMKKLSVAFRNFSFAPTYYIKKNSIRVLGSAAAILSTILKN